MVLILDCVEIIGGKTRKVGEPRGILKSMRRYHCIKNTLEKQGRRALVSVHRESYTTN